MKDDFVSKIEEMCGKEKWSATVYNELNNSYDVIMKLTQLWNTKMQQFQNEGLDTVIPLAFININRITPIVKYRAFQFRLMHNAITCNDRLVHFGQVDTNLCFFCQKHKETVVHLFTQCEIVQKLLQAVIEYFNNEYSISIEEFTPVEILFNLPEGHENDCISLAILLVKQKVYAAKCQKRMCSKEEILHEFEFVHQMEKQMVDNIAKVRRYNSRWPDKLPMYDSELSEIDEYVQNLCTPPQQ